MENRYNQQYNAFTLPYAMMTAPVFQWNYPRGYSYAVMGRLIASAMFQAIGTEGVASRFCCFLNI
jgi:hypothetical protein